MTLDLHNPHWRKLADEHRVWLRAFDPQYGRNWESVLNNNPEAGLCEASVRRQLQARNVVVEPNESLNGVCGGPDFQCSAHQRHFYVDATCVSIATATRKTRVADGPQPCQPFRVWGMTEAFFAACVEKAPQCAGLDAPALVAVGTFHTTAAAIGLKKVLVSGLLTGKTHMGWNINTGTGRQVGGAYQTTALHAAGFFKPDGGQGINFARSSISGVLVLGLGVEPVHCLGVLHPKPARPFDPGLLPGVEFGEVGMDRDSGRLRVRWLGGRDA